MTPKQEKLGKAIVENVLKDKPDNMSTMLSNVGYKETTARHRQGDIISRPGVQEAIAKATEEMLGAFEAQGITPYYVAGKIKDLMEAKKITKVAGKDGEVQIISEEDNYQAIDKGISHAAKFGIGGGYKTNDDGKPTANNIQINILNSPKVKELVEDFESKLKAELTKDPHAE